mmetsp:Transcript_9957/g.40303  ORF Transcript_9957/g.40303 Transcript_9957/m.40303 type:complete len:487 (-) Transcript_9957:545-2005(-)
MASETDTAPAVEQVPVLAPLEGEQLSLAIMRQFEFYFSPENTANDAFLVSQMDAEKYVPLSVVAGFGKVKQLTEDMDLIVSALEASALVELDAGKTKVRAVQVKPARTTLALRQVDASATTEALTALFEAGGFKPTNMRSDIGNFWFADFSSEEETTKALEYIRTQKFADKPIRARIKTSTVLSTSSYYYPTQQPYYPGFVPVAGTWVPGGPYGFTGFEPGQEQMYMAGYAPKAQGDAGRGRGAGRGKGPPRKEGARKGQAGQRDEDGRRKAGRKARPAKEAGAAGAPAAGGRRPDQKPPQLTPAHFPPLPNAQKGGKSGYKGAFKKYSPDELIAKMGELKVERPADLPDCDVVLAEPVTDVELAKEAPPNFEAIQGTGVTLSEVVKKSKPSADAKAESAGTAAAAASGDATAAAAAPKAAQEQAAKKEQPAATNDEPAKPTWSQMVRKSGSEEASAAPAAAAAAVAAAAAAPAAAPAAAAAASAE